jgi:excisionase family DNA binding protein
MNKKEAAEYLGIGVRSLERYTSDGKVTPDKVKVKTGVALDYSESELERFKREVLEAPPESPPTSARVAASPARVAASPANALARLPRHSTAMVPLSPSGAQERPTVPIEHKLLLTLAEAQAMTGLSRNTLRAAIDAGELKAKQIGRAWRVKRADLESYIGSL